MSTEHRGSVSRGFRRVLNTIRGRNNNRSDDDKNRTSSTAVEPPPLPFLPAHRPRPITPTTNSLDSLIALGTLASLPIELRRAILIAAFGERTLHLDLRLTHPRRAAVSAPIVAGNELDEHGHGEAPLGWYYRPDFDAPRIWRWYSCVCHRLLPPGSSWEQRSLARGVAPYRYPNRDKCIHGEAMMCQLWPPERVNVPGKCGVGVMGWLLACRQAYAEGIDVLYPTNTFFIESPALFDALFRPGPSADHLLLPERLSSIKSLELRWDVLLFGRLPTPRGLYRAHFHWMNGAQLNSHLSYLCNPFPNLVNLVLSFSDYLYNDTQVRPAGVLEEIDRMLLRPIAAAVSRLPLRVQQQHVVVELPSNVFRDLKAIDGRPGLGLKSELRGDEYGDGRGTWLRYPVIAAAQHSSAIPSTATNSDWEARQGEDASNIFYYIKEGEESDLFWDYNGNHRRLSNFIAHTDGRYIHLS